MTLTRCFDASVAIPKTEPDGCKAVLGYIGGQAVHVWTVEEWDRFGHLRQFPCWVADLASSPVTQATDAVRAARRLGWHPLRAIIADLEAVSDPGWWNDWAKTVTSHHYQPVWYGSASVSGDYTADFKWVADWDNDPDLPDGWAAKQYAVNVDVPGGIVDLSVLAERLVRHGGEGKRG
jgi:hypothetical protein